MVMFVVGQRSRFHTFEFLASRLSFSGALDSNDDDDDDARGKSDPIKLPGNMNFAKAFLGSELFYYFFGELNAIS